MYLFFSLKIIFIFIILKTFVYSKTNTDEDLLQENRAIGGESLDTANVVVYIDENGLRFKEVPYEYMKNWLDDQKMWRTWSITLLVLCFIFFSILVIFLIHNFHTSTGPFALCAKNINENPSDDKITTSEITDYTQTSNIPMFNPIVDSHHLSLLKNSGQL